MSECPVDPSPLLRTEGLTKTYPDGKVQALRGVSLSVEQQRGRRDHGAQRMRQEHALASARRSRPTDRRRDLLPRHAAVPDRQRPVPRPGDRLCLPVVPRPEHVDAVENVQVPMFETTLGRRQRVKRAEALIEQVGLTHRRNHRPMHLSVGERQRVAIARALANEPTLLLADEPTGNLDSRSQDEILQLLDDLRQRQGLTLIIITHSAEVAAAAHAVIRMRDGRAIET